MLGWERQGISVYQGRGEILVRKIVRAAWTGKVGTVGACTVDRVPYYTWRGKEERWKTHPNENLLRTDDDEREKR